MKKMRCPNCEREMEEVKVTSHYDTPIFVEQCSSCGGLWFDQLELFRIKHDQAGRLDKSLLQKDKVFTKERLKCPRDGKELIVFHDPHFPEEIKVESCTQCRGFWFNRGELSHLQIHRNKKTKMADQKLREQIRKMLHLHRSGMSDVVGTLGRFLSTPIDRETLTPVPVSRRESVYPPIGIGQPKNQIPSKKRDEGNELEERAARMTMEILKTLLRGLLRR